MSGDENLESFEMMAATVVHEVKNPLSLAKANIDYILLCDKEKRYSKNCNVIKDELNRAADMLTRFVDYLKPLSEPGDDEAINVFELLAHKAGEYSGALDGKIKFSLNCPEKDIFTVGNPNKLSLVVSNIIKNSVEAIHDFGSINIFVTRQSDNVVIRFCDDGEGFCEEDLEKIKSGKFFSTKPGGNGLGINICSKIIKEHGGMFSINNNSHGTGCTVELTLPMQHEKPLS